ncbi:hypothetical protein CSUB01_07829 [Colletotrichum sublineola]|uniref:Rhodopsin domain-containing protein n=1 Tax=Colletotrichum sublineola TaxID=1173701 RepID=A0A066Y0A1_COLSU|nr:hypothetical protein CSUB01_07829 [Colletotrichum sublineola]
MSSAPNNTLDFNGPPAAAIIASEFTLIGIAAVLIAARIYLRIGLQGLPLIASDLIICASWIACAAFAAFDIVHLKFDVLRPDLAFTLQGYNGTSAKIEFVWKKSTERGCFGIGMLTRGFFGQLQWASQFPFFTAFYLCKAALLTLYARFFPAFMKTRRRILWATIVFCGCAYTATILGTFFICRPLKGNWVTDPAVACPVEVFFRLFEIAWALNFTADIAVEAERQDQRLLYLSGRARQPGSHAGTILGHPAVTVAWVPTVLHHHRALERPRHEHRPRHRMSTAAAALSVIRLEATAVPLVSPDAEKVRRPFRALGDDSTTRPAGVAARAFWR